VARRRRIEMALDLDHAQVGLPAQFKNLTVSLYRPLS
jgi:hypothetical protein